jgi:two-component system sensor histidine kinase/response regulator
MSRLFLCLLCCFHLLGAVAANRHEQFRHLTVNDGLARNAVFNTLQDEQGFMWFGTWDGLYRYDGTELRPICHHPLPDIIGEQIIQKLVEDHSHRIWMGTDYGIALWDTERECVVPFTARTAQGDSIRSAVSSLYKDDSRHIWIGLENGELYRFDEDTQQLTSYTEMPGSAIRDIHKDKDGTLRVVTARHGVYRYGKTLQGMRFTQDPLFSALGTQGKHLYQDSEHCFWYATATSVYRLTPSGSTVLPSHTHAKDDIFLQNADTRAITENQQNIYIGTSEGLLVYSLADSTLSHLQADYKNGNGLNDESIEHLYTDREQGLWVATFYGGINYLSPTSGNFQRHQDINSLTNGHVISSLSEDGQGNVWMGIEDNGVCLWNRKTHTLTNYGKGTEGAFRPSSDNVQAILWDEGMLYIGLAGGGMDIVNPATGSLHNYRSGSFGPRSFDNNVYAFWKDRRKVLWVGTSRGLFLFDTRKKSARPVKEITDTKVNCITEGTGGEVWISTLGKGLFRYNPQTGRWKRYAHLQPDSTARYTNRVTTLAAEAQNLYVGTQGSGLWAYDAQADRFSPIAAHELGDKYIFRILPHGQNLWITTNKGLFCYNRDAQTLKHYTSEDGLRSNQFKVNAGLQTKDGLLVVGGVNGFNAFYESDLRTNETVPNVAYTHLYLSNRPAGLHTDGSPLKESITHTQHLTLKQSDLQFAIRFATLSYSNTAKNKCRYRLDPFEKEWQPANEAHTAVYPNLPAGEYVFHLQGSNGNGLWSTERTLAITILPYWWLSPPMKAAYALLFLIALALAGVHFRRKQAKAIKLMEMQKKQEIYQSKMEFFTCMVHEIRTPLTLIVGPLKALMGHKGNIEEKRSELQLMERNGQRLLSLVNQLMDFRKVEEKSYAIRLQPTDLRELVKKTCADFRFRLQQQSICLNLHLPDSPCYAQADAEAFAKILTNLLSNAIKFTRDRIDISLKPTGGKPSEWTLDVKDNGCGMEEKEMKHIFESFYQIRTATPDNLNGTGIGLFLVHRLLDLQGGRISVTSTPGEGSCFTAHLPACAPPEAVQETHAQPQETDVTDETPDNGIPEKRKKILLAEDDKDMQQYILSILDGTFHTIVRDNGEEALAEAGKEEYDLIITDLMMPRMDGLELSRRLRANLSTSHIPIIMLTAKDDEPSQLEGFKTGIDLYIVKPFSPDILNAQIQALIANRERRASAFNNDPAASAATLCNNETDRLFMEKLDHCIEQQLSDSSLSVDSLAAELAVGRSLFYQKVKGISGLTPNDYLRTYRLKKAALLIRNGDMRINEVCYQVGFSSPSYFAKRFSAQFGVSPSEYAKQETSSPM